MNITFTELAAKEIKGKVDGKEGFLKLKYDTDGCGCVVSGITALWLVSELDEDDRELKTNEGSVFVEKSKEVFLDDELIIDFTTKANCFQLKSPNQYLNPRMSFIDKTI